MLALTAGVVLAASAPNIVPLARMWAQSFRLLGGQGVEPAGGLVVGLFATLFSGLWLATLSVAALAGLGAVSAWRGHLLRPWQMLAIGAAMGVIGVLGDLWLLPLAVAWVVVAAIALRAYPRLAAH